MSWKLWVFFAGLYGATGVACGALASHWLKNKLSSDALLSFDTAVKYQMYHALALFCVAFIASRVDNLSVKLAGVFFVIGTFLFSGSIYILTLTENRSVALFTPLGGVLLILAWLLVMISVISV